MKVFHVVNSLDPDMGGVPRVAAALASSQSLIGHDVKLITPANGYRESFRAAYEAMPGWNQIERVSDIASIHQAEAGSASVVHLHGVWDPILIRASRRAQRLGIPYAVTPHGMLDPWCMMQSRLKKIVAMRLVVRSLLNKAAFLHALNIDEAQLMGPLGLKAPVMTVPNGVFVEEIPTDLAADDRISRMQPYVLFMGRLHHKKGLDYLAGIFERLADHDPHVQLAVAGPDEGAGDAFVASIEKAGLSERVHVLGSVYGDEKYRLLNNAAAFVLPSRQEGFSMAITEALAVGVPVVISEPCHFPEVAEVGAGAVLPLDELAFADALASILADRDLAKAQGAAGAALVRGRYTWPTIAGSLIDTFTDAVVRNGQA